MKLTDLVKNPFESHKDIDEGSSAAYEAVQRAVREVLGLEPPQPEPKRPWLTELVRNPFEGLSE